MDENGRKTRPKSVWKGTFREEKVDYEGAKGKKNAKSAENLAQVMG